MKVVYSMLLLTVLLSSCGHLSNEQTESNEWIFDKVVDKTLKFKNGNEFQTDISQLKYIGQLPNGDKAPLLIFSGWAESYLPISIFVHTPAEGNLKSQFGLNRYDYPGVEVTKDNTVLYKARTFYGEVLPNVHGIIWYQEFLMENKTWKKEVLLVEIINGVKEQKPLKDTQDINETLALLNKNLCKEIKGIKRDFIRTE